jgi:hypothetical protein
MPISLDTLEQGGTPRPPRLLVYGVKGIGKTTFASHAPNPVFLNLEDGMTSIDAPYWRLRSYAEVEEAIGALHQQAHAFQTVVLDSLDWFEPMVWAETCARNKWKSIETPGYGKGYKAAIPLWQDILADLTALRDYRKMTVILLAHPQVKRFDSPETDPYDRYRLKLNENGGALVEQAVDAVLFANFRTSTIASETTKGAVRAVSSGERFLFTTERPAYTAKNRYGLPDVLPLKWDALAQHIPWFKNPQPSEYAEQGT